MLGSNAARDYDPEGDGQESPDAVQNAIDHNPTTNWDTETYSGGFAASRAWACYVRRAPVARRLDLTTSTPGFKAAVYASDSVPGDINGWDQVPSGA